jgi:hypothetical protein
MKDQGPKILAVIELTISTHKLLLYIQNCNIFSNGSNDPCKCGWSQLSYVASKFPFSITEYMKNFSKLRSTTAKFVMTWQLLLKWELTTSLRGVWVSSSCAPVWGPPPGRSARPLAASGRLPESAKQTVIYRKKIRLQMSSFKKITRKLEMESWSLSVMFWT